MFKVSKKSGITNHSKWCSKHNDNMLDMLVVLMKPVGGLKAPTAILVRLHSHPPNSTIRTRLTLLTHNLAALTHSQHSPTWGDPCSWATFELWAGQREKAAKPRMAIFTMKLSWRQNRELAAEAEIRMAALG